jgi:hypothetical protein
MGLIRTALVFGAGYLAGRPDGMDQLRTLRTRLTELAKRPEVKKARERAWDVAGDQASALKRRLPTRAGSDDGGSGGAESTVPVSEGAGWRPQAHSAATPATATPAPSDEPLSAADPRATTPGTAATGGDRTAPANQD